MGKSAKELYEERRKKQNSSNSTNSKKSAKELYEERRKYNSIDTSNVNEEYINSFITDANSFFTSAKDEYDKVGWSNAASSYENINKSYSDLNTKFDTINAWLYKNKNRLDEDSYRSLSDSLNSVGSGFSSTIDAFSNAKDYYSQWDTEEAYNKWYKAEEEKKAPMKFDDFEEYSQKGANLENVGSLWKAGGYTVRNPVTYTKENYEEVVLAEINAKKELPYGLKSIYYFMTDDEVAIYNYWLGKGDQESANKFLSSIEDTLKQRQGKDIADNIDDNVALETVFGFASGIEQGIYGIKNLDNFITGTEADPFSSTQYAAPLVRENIKGGWGVAYDVAQATGNMLPSIMVGAATGSPLLGALTLGASAVGNAYAEMRNLGYDEWQSRGYATLVGASETVLSYALGGISKLGGKLSGKAISNLLSKIDNAFARTAIKVGGSMLSEGLEEAIQTALEPAFQALATGEDFESAKWDEILYSGLLGALTAGLLEGAPTIAGTAFNSYNTGKIYGNSAPSLVADAIKADPTNLHAQRMQTRLDNGKGVSGYQLNRLITDTDKAKIKSAIETRLTELGEKGDISKLSEALTKRLIGESLSLSEKALIKKSTFGSRIINETNPDNIEAGTYASGWAENIGTRALNPQAYNKSAYDLAKQMHGIREAVEKESVDKTLAEIGKTIEENIKVSENGKTIYNDEDVAINKIVSTKGGLKVELDNGKTVSARDLSFGTKEEALMYEMVARMETTPETANELISTFKPANMAKASQYFTSIPVAYQYGKIGYEAGLKNINLTKQEKRLAYNRGRADAIIAPKNKTSVPTKDKANTTKTEASKTEKNGIVYEGDFTYDESTATKMQKASMAHIEVIAKMSNLEVHVFESVEEKGKRVYYLNGERRLAPNGYFTDGNKIYIDFYAGNGGEGAMLYTMSHEVSHYIRKWNEKGFKELADFLIEQYGKHGVPVHKLLEDQKTKIKNRYERENKTLPSEAKLADMAYEELVADAMSDMFTDPKAYEKLLKLKQKNRTLWEKVGEAIKQLLDKLKTALGIYKTADVPVAREAYFVREFAPDVYNKLQDLYLKAFVEADANYEAAQTTLAESGIAVNPDTESATIFSVRDVLDKEQQKKVSSALATRFGVTQEEAMEWLKAETSMASLILNPKYSQYLDYEPDPNEVAIKQNADYPQGTVDFSPICAKRREFTSVMNNVLRLFPNHVFAATDLAKIRTIMQEEGMTIPCGICYVEGRRQLDTIVAQNFIDSLKLYREGSKTRPDGKPFNANQLKGLSLIDGDSYIPSVYELVSLEGLNILKEKNPNMAEAWIKFNNARGMQSVRLLANEAEYKRQILKYNRKTVQSKNNLGGLRVYSFSDAEMFHLIDIIQVITDSATVGLSLQGYTKVNEYARAVKDTGEKLNRSLIPKGELGYHIKDGKVILDYDTVEGIDINHPDFFDNKDNPNVGNITIGVNDVQIRAAMVSDFVDQIIPFHTGQSEEVLGEKGISTWSNYKDFQTEKDIATGKVSAHQINIYTEVLQVLEKEGKTITKRAFVEKFLQVCKENGLNPRFSQFLNTNEDGEYVYTEGYHKMLVDFKTFAQTEVGEYLPQMPVKPIFDNEYITKILKDYVKSQKVKDAELAKSMPKVVERITNEIVKPSEVKFSDRGSWENIESVQGLDGYSVDEVINITTNHINNILEEYGEYAEIIAVRPYGSRAKGTAKTDSDLDIVVQYEGDIREDDMFNMLNDDDGKLYIDGIEVDINPIRVEESGDIEDYLGRVYSFDKYQDAKFSDRGFSKNFVDNTLNGFGIKKLDDSVHVQRQVLGTLLKEGFFTDSENRRRTDINEESGLVIETNKSGIDETFSFNNFIRIGKFKKIAKLATIRELPNAIKHGHIVADNVANKYDNADKNKTFAYIEYATEVDGKEIVIKLAIKKSPQKNKFWVHSIYTIENVSDSPASTNEGTEAGHITADSNGIITQDSDSVKREFADSDIAYSIREEAPPKNTKEGYKVFVVKNGKLYPPMVANPNAEDTPVGVWLNADVGTRAPDSKTGRMQVKAGGKGTQGGSGSLAFRPGWHLGETPLATQFDRLNPETGVKELFPENFVWALCDIAADHDYQEEAMSYGYTKNGKFQHSLAGLPKLPADGYYKYRTNPNPDTVPWLITGAMKVKRLLSDAEVNAILESKGLSPKQRVGGNKTLSDLGLSEYEGKVFSYRGTNTISNRSLLANALEGVAQNDIEKAKLAQYKAKIALIESEHKKLNELKAEANKLRFTKGRTAEETKRMKALDFEANQVANRINTYDKQLLNLESTKALKSVLEREKANLRKRLEQKGKESLKKQKEKDAATVRELMNRYQESRTKAVEGRHKTELRHKIKNVVSDLNKLLLNPTKDQHVPIGLQLVVAEALDAINMDTMNAEERVAYYNDLIAKSSNPDEIAMLTKKRDFFEYRDANFKDRITALKNAYAEFKESDDPLIRNAHNEAIEDLIKNTADEVGSKSLKDMSYEQLEKVHNMYKAILATVRNSNKMFKEGRQATVTENSEAVKTEVKEVGGHKDRVLKITKALKKFGWAMLKPVTAMKVIGSKTFEELFKNVRAAEDTWAVDVNEAKKFYDDVAAKYSYKRWDFKKRYTFKDSAGTDFSISLEQMMSLYAYSKREQADQHLEFGGFIFDDAIEVTEKKLGVPLKYEVNDANPYRLGQIQIMEIIGNLSQDQKAFVDEMQTYLSEVMGEKGNEVSLAMYDIKLYNEKNYFPLKTARYFREFDPEKNATPKIKNSGFSKKTVPRAGNPIVLSNFMDVWAAHVNDMSMYHAFVLPLEDFMRVYNYSSTAGGYDSVQQYIKNAYGSQANQYIEKLMEDLNGGARVDSSAGFINKGLSLFKKASTFASASVVIQQPSAIARALAYINPKYFVTSLPSAINLVKHKALWAEVKKYAPVAIIKEMGYFDTGVGRSTVEWLKGNQSIKDKVDDVLSKAPAIADELGWTYIWEAVKRETQATTNLKVGSEEFLKKSGERFTEVITNTQVYDSTLSRSAMMRSKDTGMKMATAFMAEPTTTVNMMVDGILQGMRGNKKFAAATVGAISASIILNSILVSLVYAARDDDDDETYAEKYISSLTTELLDGFNPLTYIPFIKDIWSIAQGYDVERSDMSVVSNLWETIEGLFEEDKSGWEKVLDATGAVSSLFGIPLKNIIRDGKGMYNLTKTLISGTPTTGVGISGAIEDSLKSAIPLWDRFHESDSSSDKLYDVIISGNQTQIDRIKGQYKDEKAIESAMRQALRENDSRIHEAAQARYEGDIAEYTRIAREIIAEGNFSQDTVVSAINAEISAIKKGETTEEEPAEDESKDEATSIYKASDISSALENGDTYMARQIIDDLIQTKVLNGKTEKEARSSLRSSLTSYWKPLYLQAYKSGNTSEMYRIRQILYYSGLYGSANEVVKTTQNWLKG